MAQHVAGDPLPETLDQLRVTATIKEDALVYETERAEETAGYAGDTPAGASLTTGFELLEALEGARPTSAEQ